jgi:fatty acid desaturase
MGEQSQISQTRWDARFRGSAMVFGAAVAPHGADHLRRGMDVIPAAVMVAGMIQIVLAVLTIALVFRGSRWAPHAAVVVGCASAVGFTVAHLLPTWGFFSDSFINAPPAARVTWFSWVTAVFEIFADLAIGLLGVAVLRSRDVACS